MKNQIFIGLIVLLLVGCAKEEPRTAAYFLNNKEVREQVLKDCADDKGRKGVKNQECANATQAAQDDALRQMMTPDRKRVRSIHEIP
ncbi:MAG: EexN family lipoprotein [Burkholderiales bacterium]|jgi:hypothetical protein|nr:EexN family lipoprotein [Burkholderiales bacterium]